ncbi:hypothetical protein BDN67DRAFT_226819 [Paxillus ammoniavirescens]|nr:hypothetical protein BDN67DRAFT_226819 [Paxillus ammoniavirescens]
MLRVLADNPSTFSSSGSGRPVSDIDVYFSSRIKVRPIGHHDKEPCYLVRTRTLSMFDMLGSDQNPYSTSDFREHDTSTCASEPNSACLLKEVSAESSRLGFPCISLRSLCPPPHSFEFTCLLNFQACVSLPSHLSLSPSWHSPFWRCVRNHWWRGEWCCWSYQRSGQWSC